MKSLVPYLIAGVIAGSLLNSNAQESPGKEPGKLEVLQCGKIAKLHICGDILLAGQPSGSDLVELKNTGVKTIINLRHPEEMKAFNEKETVTNLGVTYRNIPWNGSDELTDDVIDQLRGALKTADRPVLLHCSSANRVGAIWLAYRVLDEGVSVERAALEAKTAGLNSAAYEAKINDYIKRRK